MELKLSQEDRSLLQRLEEELWQQEKRYDVAHMDRLMAPDFFEFGRSGRTYVRDDMLTGPSQPIDAVLPLPEFKARLLSQDIALVTYNSQATFDGILEKARRCSIWSRTANGWVLRFHQGTPYD